ncbi:unnamed protein product [Tilletia caries]|nr:unnamed protein product [Tilletia caries]
MGTTDNLLTMTMPTDSPLLVPVAIALLSIASLWLIPYFTNTSALGIPGPLLAKFSNLWLILTAKGGQRSLQVHELHKKHGKFVRLAPNHISIADPDALHPSIVAFQPFVRKDLQLLLDRWDSLCVKAAGNEGPRGLKGYAWFDALMETNYWAFDTIGDLAFGTPFGMLESGEDRVPIEYEDSRGNKRVEYGSAIQIINERGEVSATLGVAPPWMRAFLLKLPWFARRMRSVKALTGIALARVNDRLQNGSGRDDLLAKLQSGTDELGEPMSKWELTAEALTQLIAGSDTTSNSSCAILHHLCSHTDVLARLRSELDEAAKKDGWEDVPKIEDVKDLPYLRAVINESLRYHSTSGIGLPRLIPEGGVHVLGRYFPAGTVLSVPSYTIHRSQEWWGPDADEYRPERWIEAAEDEQLLKRFEKASNVFSTGPRACVGRNLAEQELLLFVATVIRRYEMELKDPKRELATADGFLRKPTVLEAGIRRRRV